MDQQILLNVRMKPRCQRKTEPRMIKREEVLIFWKLPESSATLVTPPLKHWKNKRISAKYVETNVNIFSKYVSTDNNNNENWINTMKFIWLWCSFSPSISSWVWELQIGLSIIIQLNTDSLTPPICLCFVWCWWCGQWSLVSRCNLLSWPRERVTTDFLDNSLCQSTQWPGWSGRQHVRHKN